MMATVVAPARTVTASTTVERSQPTARFLVSPVFDLLFVCNLYWPLLLLIDGWGGLRAHETLLFWQVFFVTTPHRWITLFLVFGDGEKLHRSGRLFAGLAVLIVGSVSLLWLSTGSLLCLMAVDYLWNAWHFAAQHHGIYRIYSRQNSDSRRYRIFAEKWLFRVFILYVIARVAGWSWQYEQLTQLAHNCDMWMLLLPLAVVGLQIERGFKRGWPGLIYTASVLSLFSAMLLAVHFNSKQMVLQLALASALFHAVEYLAIVSWSMNSKKTTARRDLFGHVGSRWLGYLVVFVVLIGASAWMLEQGAFKIWAAVNLMAAFLHYSFDGIIWKKPRSKSAREATS
ncbi:hypothetical protein [Rubinisphaera sp. JC750]|uniref:hypothetical protein n=1 Tax=Rubinisphaera sp. JC750 TaxID=2898658 RepID=UPI001F30FDCB|nr:hypothetical protein [Rubinisphaera sp. JC750]